MPVNLAGAVRLMSEPVKITRHRRAAGSYSAAGEYVDGAPDADLALNASVTPVTGKDLDRLPEGSRQRGAIQIFITAADGDLALADTNPLQQADRVTYNNQTWQVEHVDDWRIGGYWRALAVLEQA